ncbi:MAG: hypothetical protein ABEI77_07515 [Halorientalis sp.]
MTDKMVLDEFQVASSKISDPDGATAYEVLAMRVLPGNHPELENTGFHSPQTLFCLFSPKGRPLADYDPHRIARECHGADNGWIVDQLRDLDDELQSEGVDRGKGIETDGGTQAAEAEGESETFHVYACLNCEKVSSPKPNESSARVDRDIHNRKKHEGAPVAELRSFEESEYVGRAPTNAPDFDLGSEESDDE